MTFPVALELAGRGCLVIGRGDEARARAERLTQAGALVEEVTPADFEPSRLDDVWLAVFTERDPRLAEQIRAACESRRVWYCAIDQPVFNSFNHVSIIDVDPVLITISTGGKAPLLSRRLREAFERLLRTDAIQRYFQSLAELRARTAPEQRRQALESALRGFEIHGEVVLPPQSNDGNPSNGSGAE